MEFKTSLTQHWFPEVDPISFTPNHFRFHSGTNKIHKGDLDSSEHTINGHFLDLEMHIISLNLDKKTQDKFLASVIGIVFKASIDDDD